MVWTGLFILFLHDQSWCLSKTLFFGVTKPHFRAFINTFYPAASVISFTPSAYKGGT